MELEQARKKLFDTVQEILAEELDPATFVAAWDSYITFDAWSRAQEADRSNQSQLSRKAFDGVADRWSEIALYWVSHGRLEEWNYEFTEFVCDSIKSYLADKTKKEEAFVMSHISHRTAPLVDGGEPVSRLAPLGHDDDAEVWDSSPPYALPSQDGTLILNGIMREFAGAFATIGKSEKQQRHAMLSHLFAMRCWLTGRPKPREYEGVLWWDASQKALAAQVELLVEHLGQDEEMLRARLTSMIEGEIDRHLG